MTSLDALSARIDRLEQTVARMADLIEQKLSPVAQTTADEVVTDLAATHGDALIKERMSQLLLQLGDPEILESLTRLAVLTPKLEYAAYFAAAGPELLEEAMEVANAQIRDRGLEPHEVDRRLEKAAELLVELSAVDTLKIVRQFSGILPAFLPLAEASASAMQQRLDHEGAEELQQRMVSALLLLSAPDTQEALVRIASLAPELEYAAYFAAAGPELLEEAMELVRSKASEHNLDPHVLQHRMVQATDLLIVYTGAEQIELLRQLGRRSPHLMPVLKATTDVLQQRAAVEGAESLESRLSETILELSSPETLESLTRIAALAPKLEYAAYFAAAGPELLEEATESVRHWAAANGVAGIDDRIAAASEVMVMLSQPATLRGLASVSQTLSTIAETENASMSLQRLVTRLPELERTMGLVERALGVIESASTASGIGQIEDLEVPAVTGFKLLKSATNTETLEALEVVIESAPALARLVKPLTHHLATVEPEALRTILDVATAPSTLRLLMDVEARSESLRELLDALPTDPHTLRFLKAINHATAAAVSKPAGAVGPWQLLGVLRDPDVQRTLGVGVAVSRELSNQIEHAKLLEES